MLKLTIVHNIFLEPKHIKSLRLGDPIEIVGTSLPVWSYRFTTSEPAEEVYCKYYIYPKLQENQTDTIKMLKDGYELYLPDYCRPMRLELSREQFDNLSEIDKQNCLKKNNKFILAKDPYILEKDDDVIAFQQIHKIKESKKVRLVSHNVKIRSIKQFFDSLT